MKITPELVEDMHFLHTQGLNDREISIKLGCSTATVCLYRNGKQYRRNKSAQPIVLKKSLFVMAEEMDYSRLPDNVLFNPKNFATF